MRFALIDAEKAEFPMRTMCRVLDVSESGFFSWKGRPASQRQRDDMIYLAHIRIAFELSNRTYGSPRMHRDLVDEGLSIGRRRTARLMRENGLAARQKRRFKRTTDSTHAWPVAPNLLDQDFAAEAPDQKWSADISYILTAEGWLYLAVLIDLFSRRVVGWAVSDRLKKDLALRALRMALVTRHPPSGLIHHSDRGSQYCSIDYQAVLRKHGLLISMSGKGNCYDNAVVETFFKTIKSELIWPVSWQTRSQAENAVARYIDGFYNPIRRHSTLGYQSPVHFEMGGPRVSNQLSTKPKQDHSGARSPAPTSSRTRSARCARSPATSNAGDTPRGRSDGPPPGLLEAQKTFRRLKAYRQLPILRNALQEHLRKAQADSAIETIMKAA